MSAKAPIFEETVRNYLAQVAQIDLAGIAETLAVTVEQGEALIPFFGKTYRVSPSGVFRRLGPGTHPCHPHRLVPLSPSRSSRAPPGRGRLGFLQRLPGCRPVCIRALSTTASGPSPGTSPDAWNSSGKQPAVWEPFPRLWSSPTSSPAKFRPCPKSRCSCCLMMRMKISRPNAPCCFNAGRKNFWTWNAWLSSAGCWPIPWPKRPAWVTRSVM